MFDGLRFRMLEQGSCFVIGRGTFEQGEVSPCLDLRLRNRNPDIPSGPLLISRSTSGGSGLQRR